MSDARWRQITKGYVSVQGHHSPVRAPGETLARMAMAVRVTPTELRGAGRDDAAAELELLLERAEQERPSPPQGGYAPPLDAVTAIMAALSPEEQEEVIRRLRSGSPARPRSEEYDQHRRTG
ncbi:hypothetical protein [Streptomyces anulatus]|uniref:hypothetical protein n=1 Tax=Streptomyces anulatus TaxID=1892 RepID=UPI00368AEBA9